MNEPKDIILCRDCKHYRINKKENEYWCYRLVDRDLNPVGYYFPDTGFCSYAERKGDETNE